MSTTLHVGNISSAVVEDDLRSMFARFGQVEFVEIATDSVNRLSKGLVIVAMSRDKDAVTAIGRMNFTQYAGRTVGVSRSRS